MPGSRKIRVGEVINAKMDKTVVVAVRWQQRNLIYKKPRRRITKLYAHDNENQCRLGDMVRIEETRPLSRTKRWRLLEIVERREIAEVKPAELDEGILTEESDEDVQEEQELDNGELVDELDEASDDELDDDDVDEDLDEDSSDDDDVDEDSDEGLDEDSSDDVDEDLDEDSSDDDDVDEQESDDDAPPDDDEAVTEEEALTEEAEEGEKEE